MHYNEMTPQLRASFEETILGVEISASELLDAKPEDYRPGMQPMPKAKFDKAAKFLLDDLDALSTTLIAPPPVE